jgi:RNA polymerase sigma-70 factor (ECF subfamily)
MVEQDDTGLVRRAKHGERGAFEALVAKYQKAVFNVALRMTRDRDEAEDVSQTVFLKSYVSLSSYDERFKFFSWLYRIAVNESIRAVKRRQRYLPIREGDLSESPAWEADHSSEEQTARLLAALQELKPEQRALVVLKHLEQLSYEEVGQILAIPEKKVKSRLFAARLALKEVLERKGNLLYEP